MTPLLLLLLVLPTLRLNSFQGPVTILIGLPKNVQIACRPWSSLGPRTFHISRFLFHATRQQLKYFDTCLFLSFLRTFFRPFPAIIRFVFVACWSFCKKISPKLQKKKIQLGISNLGKSLFRSVCERIVQGDTSSVRTH